LLCRLTANKVLFLQSYANTGRSSGQAHLAVFDSVVGNCCYVAVCSAAEGASAPTGGGWAGAYRAWRPPAYSLFYLFIWFDAMTAYKQIMPSLFESSTDGTAYHKKQLMPAL